MAFLEAFRGILSHTSFKMVWHHSLWDIYLLSFYIVNLSFCVNFVSILCSVNEVKKRKKDKVCVYLCKGKRQVSAVHKRRERSARPQLPFDDVESLFKKPCEGGIPVHGLSFRHGKCYLCKSKVTQKKNPPGFTLWVYFSLLGFSFYLYMTYKVYLIYTHLH